MTTSIRTVRAKGALIETKQLRKACKIPMPSVFAKGVEGSGSDLTATSVPGRRRNDLKPESCVFNVQPDRNLSRAVLVRGKANRGVTNTLRPGPRFVPVQELPGASRRQRDRTGKPHPAREASCHYQRFSQTHPASEKRGQAREQYGIRALKWPIATFTVLFHARNASARH